METILNKILCYRIKILIASASLTNVFLKSFRDDKARSGSRTAATSKMELFVITVTSWKPLTIITKCSILDVAAVLDPPLKALTYFEATGTGKRFWTKSSFCLSNEIL